jgi:hypothetical protein
LNVPRFNDDLCLRSELRDRDLGNAEDAHATLVGQRLKLDTMVSARQADVEAASIEHRQRVAQVQRHRKTRPGLLVRLFRRERWRAWSQLNMPLVEGERRVAQLLHTSEQALSAAVTSLEALISSIGSSDQKLTIQRKRVAELSQAVEEQRRILLDRLVDEHFFTRGHEAWNLACPWLPDSLQRKREDLFGAALAVHRAFIDAAAQKVLHNLSALMSVFSSGPMQDQAKRRLLVDLWSTLFLVVPVVSTAFASVDRMLGDLPADSIGWLLIDEGGQALPQAAVGAIMRARRSIVVGDPLQIPPVVTLPERLTSEICNFFKIEKSVWAAPQASAQTIADRSSRFQAVFRSDQGPRRVGIPLLVHRRCQEPMFGVSNRIAYDGQMVHAPCQYNVGPIDAVLGPSKWLDIDGDADSKWCAAEGELVVDLLKQIAAAGITHPDVFVITPFRIIAQEMKRRLERENSLLAALEVDIRWAVKRVGTIHTVQGREADTVILVLGAPKASQSGARNWAASEPNILNVAVSRAKQNLYVVGSHGAWCGVGHARELASSLQRIRV